MKTTSTDPCAAERGTAKLGWLVALAGVLLAVAAISVLVVSMTLPGWLLAARQRTVDGLSWTKGHWLSTAALGAAAAVTGALAPFMIRWLDRRRPVPTSGLGGIVKFCGSPVRA